MKKLLSETLYGFALVFMLLGAVNLTGCNGTIDPNSVTRAQQIAASGNCPTSSLGPSTNGNNDLETCDTAGPACTRAGASSASPKCIETSNNGKPDFTPTYSFCICN